MTPTRASGPDPLPGEDLAQRQGPVARLAREAQVLEALPFHRERRGPGHAPALVPDEDRRDPARPQDEDRLLEPRVEPGEEREVGAVLPIGVDDQAVVPARIGPRPQGLHAGGVRRGRDLGPEIGHAEVGQLDLGKPWGRHRPRGHVPGTHRRGSAAPRSISRKPSAVTVIQGPAVASGQMTRTSAWSADPRPTCVQPT